MLQTQRHEGCRPIYQTQKYGGIYFNKALAKPCSRLRGMEAAGQYIRLKSMEEYTLIKHLLSHAPDSEAWRLQANISDSKVWRNIL